MSSFYPSDKEDEALLAKFTRTCSKMSLEDFFLRRLNRDDELRKQIAALIEQRINNMALVLRAQWLRDHPELRGGAPPRKAAPGASHENLHGDSLDQRPDRLRGES